jgi:hypothetical protein
MIWGSELNNIPKFYAGYFCLIEAKKVLLGKPSKVFSTMSRQK